MNSNTDIEQENTSQAGRSRVERLLAEARHRLVETGTRNRWCIRPEAASEHGHCRSSAPTRTAFTNRCDPIAPCASCLLALNENSR